MRGVLIAAMQAALFGCNPAFAQVGGMVSPNSRYQRNLAVWHGTWFAGSPDRKSPWAPRSSRRPDLVECRLAQWG